MIDLGIVHPGSTIRIPFSSFDKDDGSAITMTNFAAADMLLYKDGGTTERASTSGYTATTDFDGKTGKHLAIIDLADNTTAGFYSAGSEYLLAIDSVTVDGVTTGGWIARFRIGHPAEWFSTTIASLSSQTSFTLTNGPAEDDALNGFYCIIHDIASAVQCGKALILDYTGSTKTVTLAAGTTFTAAAGDNISIMDMAPLQPATIGRTLAVGTAGQADGNVTQFGGTNLTASGGRPEVNTTLIEGSDATNQIRDAIVDDATRIDASALNTLSSHDPGEAIMGATDLGTGSGLTSLATAAELAKVPKSDGTATWNATAAAQIQSEANDALVAYDPPTKAELDAAVANVSVDEIQPSALADLFNTDSGTTYGSAVAGSVVKEIADNAGGSSLTAADIADAVWEEAIADHSGTAGSTAEQLAAAGAAGDPWATALPGAYGSGTAGKIVGDNLNATVSSRASQSSVDTVDGNVDSILADSNELQTDWANGGRLDLILDARASQASVDDLPTNAELATALDPLPTASENATAVWGAATRRLSDGTNIVLAKGTGVTGFNDLSAAQVNAEVDTAISDAALATAANLATVDGVVDAIKVQTDKFTNLPVITAAGTGGQGFGAP